VQKSLVEDIRALVIGSKTDEVRIGTSPRDAYAAKRCVEVSSTIFTSTIQFVSAIQFFVGYSIFVSHLIFVTVIQFLCQPFFVSDIFVSAILPVPATLCLSHFVAQSIIIVSYKLQ
jgi:hypothetical protein